MKRALILLSVTALVSLVGLPLVAQTKQPALKVGFVKSELVVEAHPDYPKLKDIKDQSEKELKPLRDKLTALDQKIKAGTATAKEQQDFQVLRQTYTDTAKKWQEKTTKVLDPITQDIDAKISKIAQEKGFQVIMDYKVALTSSLVIYAAEGSDLTDDVIKAVK